MKIKKVFIGLLIILVLNLGGCANYKEYEEGYFIFWERDDQYYLSGLTELGMEQEILVIPETYKGKEFILRAQPRALVLGSQYPIIGSDNARKIYMSANHKDWPSRCFWDNLKAKVIIIANEVHASMTDAPFYYVSKKISDKDIKEFGHYSDYVANVSYYYNYEEAPNSGNYWIDDFDYGEKISYIPENPTREGYLFYGWYKEAECINLWNVETDTLPEEKREGEKVVYQETILYAKWLEKVI